jgi:HlyD family secretion protein
VATTRAMKRTMIVAVGGLAAAAAWIANSQQTTNGTTAVLQTDGPLIARGYTDAPAGTVLIASNPNGGVVLKEVRIKEGQMVKRGEVIAVMSSYDAADISVKIAENNLRKTENVRDFSLKGTGPGYVKLEEDALKSAIENDRLATMLRSRSGRPLAEKELEVWVAEQNLKNQRAALELSQRRLEIDLERVAVDIAKMEAAVDHAAVAREEALVRSPIDGVVTQINVRKGEMAVGAGIAKVVDMRQLRVFATVDELHLPRLKLGAPVEITFRGSPIVYKGKIAIAPMAVKREKRSEADFGVASVRQIEVEIEAADGVTFPEMLGREARVTFL